MKKMYPPQLKRNCLKTFTLTGFDLKVVLYLILEKKRRGTVENLGTDSHLVI